MVDAQRSDDLLTLKQCRIHQQPPELLLFQSAFQPLFQLTRLASKKCSLNALFFSPQALVNGRTVWQYLLVVSPP